MWVRGRIFRGSLSDKNATSRLGGMLCFRPLGPPLFLPHIDEARSVMPRFPTKLMSSVETADLGFLAMLYQHELYDFRSFCVPHRSHIIRSRHNGCHCMKSYENTMRSPVAYSTRPKQPFVKPFIHFMQKEPVIVIIQPQPSFAAPMQCLTKSHAAFVNSREKPANAHKSHPYFFLPFPFAFEMDPLDATLPAREDCALEVALVPFLTMSSCLF